MLNINVMFMLNVNAKHYFLAGVWLKHFLKNDLW